MGLNGMDPLICGFFSTNVLEKILEIFNNLKKEIFNNLKIKKKICYEYIKHVDTWSKS